jgi:signal transduction histidine kinase
VRRTLWPFAVAALLAVLLAVLGTMQYRWLGEVSNAERERLRAGLRTRATDFSQDFDREITRTYLAFHVDSNAIDRDAAATLADAYARAQASSSVGGIVRGVYFLEGKGPHAGALQALDPAARTLTAVDWPPALEPWHVRANRVAPLTPGALSPVFLSDAIDASVPALVVPIPTVKRIENGQHFAIVPDPTGIARTVIVWLDAERLKGQLLESLVAKHFGSADASEYVVTIVSRDEPARVVFASSKDSGVTPRDADVATGLFDLRLDDLRQFSAHLPPPPAPPGDGTVAGVVKDRLAITIVRRANNGDAARVLMAGGDDQGAWQVLLRFKSGSLETLVARSRNRNLAVGLGILGLLAFSAVFLIGAARRQERLAQQQMQFVAAVSHELRTPLAVIRSAGENLADGVVADGDQVKRYGALIGSEGRRLTDMVERVMEFAGMSSGAPIRPRADVDIARVVADAVAGVESDARERGVTVALRASQQLPVMAGDPDALRAAIQNVIGNAVKYSAAGTAVDVAIDGDTERDRVHVVVSDRGLGIDSADLPHLFKPFFRGKRAVAAQIRGTGVGLSVVRHVVDAHRGEIAIAPRQGGGTIVTVTLPIGSGGNAVESDAARGASKTARAAT